MFDFKTAIKLPFYIYGKVKLSSLKGSIKIDAPIKRGMIGFGQIFEKMTVSKGTAEININGNVVFKGHTHFGKDVFLYVADNSYCEFGFMSSLGSDVKIICTHKIIMGNWAGVGYESQLVDTNSHPYMNSLTKENYPINSPIKIGNYNAISNRVSIMSKTVTPDYCIIASNSVCNKDYRNLGTNILIGGIPAKLVKENFTRNWEIEKKRLQNAKRVYLD